MTVYNIELNPWTFCKKCNRWTGMRDGSFWEPICNGCKNPVLDCWYSDNGSDMCIRHEYEIER